MSVPRIANRLPRQGKANPGRKHLAGRDVSASMQRQYEHILESLRAYHRFGSDEKRKQVAAATVRKMQSNPSSLRTLFNTLEIDGGERESAEALAQEFHGRPVRDVLEVEEHEAYDEHGAILGYLEELTILAEDDEYVIPIQFSYDKNDASKNVLVVSNPAGTNIEFVGGDQDIDWAEVDGASEADKYLVCVGSVYSIAYWADKHHLEGPRSQAQGVPYEHDFGDDDDGELPYLIFDRRNKKLWLVGGSYTVQAEGIVG